MNELEKFENLGVSQEMLAALRKKGFEEPTPIQVKIIPILLSANKDLVGQAQTGTGKTAAFGIPILENIEENTRYVQVIILTPTRELAIQVSEEINSLKGRKKIQVIPIYGGQSMELQLKRLKKGVEMVVGTPGRVLDHIKRGTLKLENVSYAVLDEADEMLNMGFIDDVEEILAATNKDRTTLLFSATMPREIMAVAKRHMKGYELIKTETEKITVDLTDQIYFEVPGRDKFEALCRIIDFEKEFYGLIFCRTKIDVDTVSNHLKDRGYDAEGLHGDISQHRRERILGSFRDKKINILIATDVAARGIDIENLTHVINYSIPQDPESYVHRIGRTGRAGKSGTAITFITPEEYRKLMHIKKAAKTDIRRERLPKVDEIIEAKKYRVKNKINDIYETDIQQEFVDLAREVLEESSPEQLVASLLQDAFSDDLNPQRYNEVRDVYPKIQGKTRLFIARGKKDDMNKRKLVSFIKNKANVEDRSIDDVQVFDKFSFITVPLKEAEHIIECFKKENSGRRPLVEMATKSKKGK
ncbi:MAG: DEAD/DEAH box helicase [Candidatus Dadabacteria bacterium]|nr:DEAD/DEAH box helicase [Candidatus Dadabacteria bacterium]NIS07883.1 DEAD/DEAH box helicase [Candidatus Dadabacteria bacterium]NIV42903.1 DEAD/DEAH box helicase [Candidatus Dadabacteria bacterium]NIX14873.1 DEAD/DEAH box helicase [Candidatus Dadabacteria bacterium]NIY21487.1 DEAD/DEAH box helicase [Candidatus Dadabacteria bacterium]